LQQELLKTSSASCCSRRTEKKSFCCDAISFGQRFSLRQTSFF
jgi:hypothetical protein